MNEKIQVSAWGIRHNLGPISLAVRNAEGKIDPIRVTEGEVKYTLPEVPAHIRESFGVTAMEIPDFYLINASNAERDGFRDALVTEGVTLSTVTVDCRAIGDGNDEYRADDVAAVKRSIALTSAVGGRRARVNLFFPPIVEEAPHTTYDVIVEILRDLVEFARSQGVQLMMENHCELSDESEKVHRLLAAVPGLGFILDSGNIGPIQESILASRADRSIPKFVEDPREAFTFFEQMLPKADLVHIKTYGYDKDGNSYVYDVDRIVKMISDSPFKGPITIECGAWAPELVYDAIGRTAEKLEHAL